MREPQVNAIARITLSEIRELATRDIREDGVTGEAQKIDLPHLLELLMSSQLIPQIPRAPLPCAANSPNFLLQKPSSLFLMLIGDKYLIACASILNLSKIRQTSIERLRHSRARTLRH
jgi:hypothetical protein